MPANVARWGNSLAVRIPRALAERAHIAEGTPIELREENGRIVIEPVVPPLRLEDLLARVTPEAMHEAFDWGPDVGREILD